MHEICNCTKILLYGHFGAKCLSTCEETRSNDILVLVYGNPMVFNSGYDEKITGSRPEFSTKFRPSMNIVFQKMLTLPVF